MACTGPSSLFVCKKLPFCYPNRVLRVREPSPPGSPVVDEDFYRLDINERNTNIGFEETDRLLLPRSIAPPGLRARQCPWNGVHHWHG